MLKVFHPFTIKIDKPDCRDKRGKISDIRLTRLLTYHVVIVAPQ